MKPWEEPRPDAERARLLVEAVDGRTTLKRLGAWLDAHRELVPSVVAVARQRGVPLKEEALEWPGKKLLRRARGREAAARERKNPIRRDEAFTCAHCAAEVPPHGRTARDHCPWCLRSLHVDVVPGDRAAECGAVMHPVRLEQRGGSWVIHYRCSRCGHERVNRALTDGVSDDPAALRALTG